MAWPGSEVRVGTGGLVDGSSPAGSRGGALVGVWGEALGSLIYADSLQLSNVFLSSTVVHKFYAADKCFSCQAIKIQ